MWTYSSDITFPEMGHLLCLDRRDKIIVLHSGFISSREYFKRTDKLTGLSSHRFEIMSRLIHLAPDLKIPAFLKQTTRNLQVKHYFFSFILTEENLVRFTHPSRRYISFSKEKHRCFDFESLGFSSSISFNLRAPVAAQF